MSKKIKKIEKIRNLRIEEDLQREKEQREMEQKKEEKRPFILLASAFALCCLTCFVLCTYFNYLASVEKTETVNIMSADYPDTDSHTSSVFTLSESFNADGMNYGFYEEQEDGSYKSGYALKVETSIIKDLEEGEQPYLTRDVTHNGDYQNVVLHLPKNVRTIRTEE